MVKVWDQEVYSSMVSYWSSVVVNMIAIRDLHDR